jgi:hypothetical protein
MPEDTLPEMPDQLSKMVSMFSGGVMNPLNKEQVRIDPPDLKITVPPNPNGPGSQIPKLTGDYNGKIDNPVSYAMALKSHMENPEAYARDQYKYGKNYAYDADYTGLNFQRYYNAPKIYKQVGFSPWRDNEKIYNEKMTWWDSFKRSAGQSGQLMGTGFSSMLPWNAWDGDDTDEESAKDMERAHAIGYDNKGGVGGFANNLMLDAGYTMGIGAEFAAEELALWAGSTLLAPFTGGGSWVAAGAETASQVAKISKLTTNLGTAGRILNKIHEGLAALKDISKARDVFNYVKSGKPVNQLMEILTPGTFKFAQETAKLARTAKTGENIYNLATAAKGVGAFYRDAREIAAVLSESKLEGGSTELEMRKQLTDDFFRDNGRMPSAVEYQQIFQHAYDAGRETYLWNMPALWISNKIVFDKAFKGIKPLQTFRKELSEGMAGKLVFDEVARKAGRDAWSVVQTGMKADLGALFNKATWAPKNLLRNTLGNFLNYGKVNITEALQEQYQDAVSSSMKEYYTDRYKHPGRTAMHESWGDIFAENLGKQFTTKQGWETFASGFLMGSLVQIPQHIVYEKLPQKFYQIADPAGYSKFKAQREERTNNVVAALNAVTKDPMKFFNPNVTDAVSQGILNDHITEAATEGDSKQYTDIKDESVFEHLHTLLQTDKLGLVTDYLKDMKDLSGEELEQAYGKVDPAEGDAKVFYNRKLDSMIERADYIQRRNEFIENKYGNPFNPHKFSPGKDQDKYNEEVYKWQGWEEAKKMAVFSMYSFDRTVERMKSIMDDMSRDLPVANAPANDFTMLMDPSLMSQEAKLLRGEVRGMKDIPGTKREAAQKQKKLDALDDFAKSVAYYRDVLKDHTKDENITPEKKVMMKDALKNLHKSFKNYTKVVAGLSNGYTFDDKVNSGFTKIKDFYHLKNDSNNMADIVNMLENPDNFTLYAVRAAKVKEQIHKDRVELFRQSFTDKLKADDFNQLLNQIFELGAYVYPEDISNFREGKLPANFYDVTTGDKVPEDSEKYKKIMDLVTKYKLANEPIVEEPSESAAEETPQEEAAKVKITARMPIATIKNEAPDLLKELVEAYRDLNRKLYEREEEMLDSKALDKSDEEIESSIVFKNFIGNPGKPSNIISEYNKRTGRTLEPEIVQGEAVAKAKAPVVNIVTMAMKQKLADLGYEGNLGRFTYGEAKRIIDNKIKPGSEELAKIKAEEEAKKANEKSREEIVRTINAQLDNITSITDLEAFEKTMGEMLLESNKLLEIGLNSDILEEMIQQKKSELRVTFADVKEGEAVRVKKYGIMVIRSKTNDGLKLTKVGEPEGFILTIKKEDVPDQIDFREGMEDLSVSVSDIDLKAIKDTEKTRDSIINNDDERKSLEKDSQNKSEDDLMGDLGEDNCTVK